MDTGPSPSLGGSPAAFFGDCAIRLTHRTSYEPPLYLFPELLPSVPEDAPPVAVWDAVADAVDVSASYWRIAEYPTAASTDALNNWASTVATGGREAHATTPSHPYGTPANSSRPLTTLAAMLASNRLLPAGLTQQALETDGFCAASLMAELAHLQERAGIAGTVEGATLMTNHFVNVMAWRKLREVNYAPSWAASKASGATSASTATSHSASDQTSRAKSITASAAAAAVGSRGSVLDGMSASPDPWSRLVDDRQHAGRFVAGSEANVEQRVELLSTLTALYGEPWRRLCSRGVQTDYVVPRGSLNPTAPYADPFRERDARGSPGGAEGSAQLRCVEDVGWAPVPAGGPVARFAVLVCCGATAANATSGSNSGRGPPPRLVPLPQGTTTFGRHAGTVYDGRAGPLRVDVGLAPFVDGSAVATTTAAATLSALHGAFIVRPVFADVHDADSDSQNENSENEDSSADGEQKPMVLHRKTPTGYTLDVMSYGRNGMCISGEPKCRATGGDVGDVGGGKGGSSSGAGRWLLGGVARLLVGSEVQLPGGVVLRIVAADDEEATGHMTNAVSGVKRERQDDNDGVVTSVHEADSSPPMKMEHVDE